MTFARKKPLLHTIFLVFTALWIHTPVTSSFVSTVASKNGRKPDLVVSANPPGSQPYYENNANGNANNDPNFPLAQEVFPGALTYPDLISNIEHTLSRVGYDISTTLVATSLCGDELNRPLEQILANTFGPNYSLGGLAGCPFGGVTSFRKMKNHIPDNGKGFVVFGPHVGMDAYGNLGRVQERSKIQSETRSSDDHLWCCRSAILASNHVRSVARGEQDGQQQVFNPMDISQQFVQNMLMPFAGQLEQAALTGGDNEVMFQLPRFLFLSQKDLLQQIISQASQAGFPGDVAVLGGIQINTPPGKHDYFQPLLFDYYSSNGQYQGSLLGQ